MKQYIFHGSGISIAFPKNHPSGWQKYEPLARKIVFQEKPKPKLDSKEEKEKLNFAISYVRRMSK